ncbi:MAG: hypothetical protein WAU00_18395 [Caldilinea sp.]|uniref:hypothetical protein n=1 Tax=Caldilinea sp. TaxID=2293560 RepID=UPI002C54235A|nr:hypothetical protein [Anaerolineales bacterium]HQY92501.1 hypothetical protein [Caldilinea sp.]HRA65213.1 hypothetical protein [Caldilinea sp.]
MPKELFSNTLLMLGVVALLTFGIMEGVGIHTDPLVPAFAAFLIGMTAVMDRGGFRRLR